MVLMAGSSNVSEAQIQISIVRWLQDVMPSAVVHHSPNGGVRKAHYVMQLKALGMRPGWPDLELIVPPTEFIHAIDAAPIFLEVKSRTGRLSEAQRACHSELSACGVHVYTVRAIGDCRAALTGLVTLRQPTPHGRLIEELSKQMGGY